MPPKRKITDTSSSGSTTTTSTTTTTTSTPPTSSPPKSKVQDDDDDDILIDAKTKKKIRWYWAGDSKSGQQDKWEEYSKELSEKLEKAFQDKKTKKVKIDDHRFVDIKAMSQKRYDDTSKQRAVSRTLEYVSIYAVCRITFYRDSSSKAKGPTQKPQSRETKDSDSDSDGSAKKKRKTSSKKKGTTNSLNTITYPGLSLF